MFKKKRLTVLSMSVLLALLVAAVMPFAVFADDGVPPVDVPAVEEVAPPVEEVAPPVDAAPTSVPEILDQLPADTGLVVVDQNSEALPLASVAAADVLAAPDPSFTVAGTLYQFTALDCDPGLPVVACEDPIQAAVDYLSSTLNATPDDGNIYVQSGTYTANPSGGLTIAGSGWNPGNLGLVGAGSGTTIYNGWLDVYGLSNSFTLSGFTFDHIQVGTSGDVTMSDVVVDGTNADGGIGIETNGNVTMDNVTSFESSNHGADVYTMGNIKVTNSNFHNNTNNGLYASTYGGKVTLNNVTATQNGDNGGRVWAYGDITVNGGNFNHNAWDGLDLSSNPASKVPAGALGNIALGPMTVGDITVNGGNFNNNGSTGLYASTGGGFKVAEITGGNITVSGGNFNSNGDVGLYAETYNGNVTLDHVTAVLNGNGTQNVNVLAKHYGAGAVVYTSSGNIIVQCGNYSSNNGYGLDLNSEIGNINLNSPVLNANTEGPYTIYLSDGKISFGGCPGDGGKRGFTPQNNLPQEGPGPVCDGEKKVTLQAGDAFGDYKNLCDVEFQLKEIPGASLPGELPAGATQLASLKVELTSGGTPQTALPDGGKITLKFPIPAGTNEASLVVLFWNGSDWVEVTGGKVVDGFYVVQVDNPGNYVLATQ
jgi:hypothetical protein